MYVSKQLPKNLYIPLSLGYCMALEELSQNLTHELQVWLATGKEKQGQLFQSRYSQLSLAGWCLYFCLLTKEYNICKKIVYSAPLTVNLHKWENPISLYQSYFLINNWTVLSSDLNNTFQPKISDCSFLLTLCLSVAYGLS